MKTSRKLFSLLCLGLVMGACSSEEFDNSLAEGTGSKKVATFKVDEYKFDSDAMTRTDFSFNSAGFTTAWSANDTLGIFPERGDQAYFAIPDEGVGQSYAIFDGGGWLLRNASTYYSYYPFSRKYYQSEDLKAQITVNYEGQRQVGNNSSAGLGKYDFMSSRATSADKGTVNFQYGHLGAVSMIKVTSPVEGTFTKLRITADESRVFGLKSVYDISSATESEIPTLLTSYNGWWDDNTNNFQSYLELDLTDVSATLGQELTFYMMIPPTEIISKLYLTLYTGTNQVYVHDITFGKQFRPGYAYLLDFREALGDDYEQISPASENTFVDNGYSTVWTVHTTSANYMEKIDAVKQALIDMRDNYDPRMITLKMPEVTKIPANAFNVYAGSIFYSYINNLYAFEGENVNTVEGDAFWGINSLTRISLPNAVTVSGFGTTGLISVSLPNVETLTRGAFDNCSNLTTVNMPKLITIEDGGGFGSCTNLSSYYMPLVEYIGTAAFDGCQLTSIDFPEATHIGSHAFRDNNLPSSVNLPKVTEISREAFSGCSGLLSVSLPSLQIAQYDNGVQSAFAYCTNLGSVNLPNLENLAYGMFSYCTNLTDVYAPKATSIGEGCFSYCTNLTTFSAPEATIVGVGAFRCSGITTVNLPKVVEVQTSAFYSVLSLETISLPMAWNIGPYAFGECRYLKSVSLPSLSQTSYQIFTGDLELQTLHFGDYSERLQTEGMNGIDTGVFDGAEVSGCTIYIPDEPNLAERLDLSGFAHIYKGGDFIR